MNYKIRMGIPKMCNLWNRLKEETRNKTISKKDFLLYKKWGEALIKLSSNPFYPSLNTHEITDLTKKYKIKIFESYLENSKSKAMRMFWTYGPNKNEITILGLEPHPENKNKSYKRIKLDKI